MPAQSSDEPLVDLYLLLSDFGESDVVHSHVPGEAEILELGCGTGRMTRRLLELGHPVTCVDVSATMLDHAPREAEKVLVDIESLELGRQFPVVLLASNLVNRPDEASRHGLLESCRRHVTADGQVIIQRYSPTAEGRQDRSWTKRGQIELRVAEFERDGCEISATLEYRNSERLWSHSFTAVILDDEALEQEARAAGLCWGTVLTADGQWVELRPGGG